MNTNEARAYFPRGLFQPAGSFRFSADALLLASFAVRTLIEDQAALVRRSGQASGGTSPRSLLDLGCGCGVVAFGVMIQHPGLTACGVDIQPELLEAAQVNAEQLGFAGQFQCIRHDLASQRPIFSGFRGFSGVEQKYHLVTANPPYRLAGSGRLPASQARRTALFGDQGNLDAFTRAAALNLHPFGAFCTVFPWKRREDLLRSLAAHGLKPDYGIAAHTKDGAEPALLLLRSRKTDCFNTGAEARTNLQSHSDQTACRALYLGELPITSLALHKKSTAGTIFTDEAIEFCPYLGGSQPRPAETAAG